MSLPRFPAYPPRPAAPVTVAKATLDAGKRARYQSRDWTTEYAQQRAPLIYGTPISRGRLVVAHNAPDEPWQDYPEGYVGAQYYGWYYVAVVWGLGPLSGTPYAPRGFSQVFPGNSATHYLGVADQPVDPTLAAKVSGYADTLRTSTQALAYSTFRVAHGTYGLDNDLWYLMRVPGRVIYDPRLEDSAYSANPALALADFLTLCGMPVDWASVETAADYCDETVNGAARWTLHLALAEPRAPGEWIEELRAYAHCLVDEGPDGWRLIPDAPRATDHTLTATDFVAGSVQVARRGASTLPTAVTVSYVATVGGGAFGSSGTTTPEPATLSVTATHPDVATGALELRDSVLDMPGISTDDEARRFASERLRALWLRDLTLTGELFDDALAIQVGDVVAITHPLGLDADLFRVTGLEPTAAGRWRLEAERYDAAVYSNESWSEPTLGDPIADPLVVPTPTGLAAGEELFQLLDGTWASRVRITWDALPYAYDHFVRLRISESGALAWLAEVRGDSVYVTSLLPEQLSYQVTATAVGVGGVESDPTTAVNFTVLGKFLPPGAPSDLQAAEIAGTVILSWQPAIDIGPLRYEVRYGATGGDWDSAERIDLTAGLRLETADVPPGTYVFYVKTLDAVGLYSSASVSATLTVTANTSAYPVANQALVYDAANSSAIYTDRFRDGTVQRFTEIGTSDVATLFPNAANTYTDPWGSYDNSGTSTWQSESIDLGATYTGAWTVANTTAFSAFGTGDAITLTLQLSTDGTTWGDYTSFPVTVAARYARVQVTTASGHSLLQSGSARVRLTVVVREETDVVSVAATGATTVSLAGDYSFFVWLGLTPENDSGSPVALMATYEEVDLTPNNTFDVRLFNAAGTQVAGDVVWRFQGV